MTEIAFVPETPFVEQNRGPIERVFCALVQEHPERFVHVDGQEYSTAAALKIDDQNRLTPAARKFLWVFAQGAQHGYDRGVQGKILIPDSGVSRYISMLGDINYGAYNLVAGGQPNVGLEGRNVVVGCGFPHLNAGRLMTGLAGSPEQLWTVNSLALPTGQRPRWHDNRNEATSDIVIERTALFMGLDLHDSRDKALLELWQAKSRFAREQLTLPEDKRFAFETDEARVALELGMLCAGELFNLDDYSVREHRDEGAEPLQWAGGVVPAREVAAYEYLTIDGRSFWVVNAPAVKRFDPHGKESEPRPSGDSAIREAYSFLAKDWQSQETVIATGAPHIRLGLDTAIRMVQMSDGRIKTLHLASGHWGLEGEPPITGIANIVSTYKADQRVRALLTGKDPDSLDLRSL